MGWSHPDISLEDLLVLIKGCVDILVLASGYQSSGLPATWDVDNIKKAVGWGLFFEDVFKRLRNSADYEESVEELDAALLNLTSNLFFPQGLAHISSDTLSRARRLIIEHLLQIDTLKTAHFNALLTAIIEMDIDDHPKTDDGSSDTYVDRLMLQMELLNLIPAGKDIFRRSKPSSSTVVSKIPDVKKDKICNPAKSNIELKENIHFVDHSCILIQEILKKQGLISCISSAETGLDTLLKFITRNNLFGSEHNLSEGHASNDIHPQKLEMLAEIFLWKQWRSRCLSYLLDRRTIKMLAGADLIFSAPKGQWVQVFELLKVPVDVHGDSLLEIMEILFLGIVSGRWNFLVGRFMLHTCDFIPITKQCTDLHHLLQGNFQQMYLTVKALDSKEKDILEYVTLLFDGQPHKLWLLPPILAAAAIPSWSILFRMYLTELEKQFDGASKIRCCDCNEEGKEHRDCEVAERIRCLYIFHVQDSHLMVNDFNA